MFKKNYQKNIYLFLLGAISAFSLPPYNYFLINFITFSAFFIFLLKQKKEIKNNKSYFKYGWIFGFGYFLSSLYWISIALTFDQDFKILIPISLVLLPAFLAIFYGFITYLFSVFYSKRIFASLLLFSLVFSLIEFLRGSIFTGFPWNLIAFSFSDSINFIQVLSLIGTYSFNLICITIFTCPAIFFLKNPKKEVLGFSIFFVIAVSFLIFGSNRVKEFHSVESHKNEYLIRSVSSNIGLDRFYNGQDEIKIINELISLSKPKNKKPTIFLWPEGMINTHISDIKIYEDLFSKHFKESDVIIFGISNLESKQGKDFFYNSLGIFDNHLNLLGSYNKNKLVPFGEFLPFENILQFLGFKIITNNYQSFSKGEKRSFIKIDNNYFDLTLLPLICYEIIYSGNLFKDNKFDYILNISEDGWFGKSIGPKQHFSHAIFRSIESGKYIIRSANNGISAIINPIGEVEKKIKFGNEGYIDFIESKNVNATLFSKYGNKIFILLILLYIFLIFSFNRIKNE